jgi:gamma-glutamyltranspeptidase/glutathione hydrolase
MHAHIDPWKFFEMGSRFSLLVSRCRSVAVALGVLAALAAPAARTAETGSERAGTAIASAHPLATAAGHEILKRGGNAFDAAVAVAAVLAVVEPYASGLGGGGLWLLHRAADGRQVMVDARETAPAGVKPELYIDASGKPIRGATTQGGAAAAIPGAPAALVHVAARYGALPLAVSLAPAVRRARDGFPVDARYARLAGLRERLLRQNPDASRVFLDGDRAPRAGWLLRQPELGETLELLARDGNGGFYGGAAARALVDSVNRAGGVWQLSDLAGYRVIERAPLRFQYRGASITTAALPSAGGVALAQSLQMLERFETDDTRSPRDAHLVIEALRRAFRDRAAHLGDPDFVAVPVERLTSGTYARERAATIDPGAATRSDMPERDPGAAGSTHTTHLSVVDAAGNRVAATLTINLVFGSGVVARGTGVLLNNEMDDFTVRADMPNAFGLRGGEANAIAPGKRPLSSMMPTFVEDAKGVLVVGTPGGSRIVSQVLLAVLDYVHAPELDLAAIVRAPRYHHQWWPDRVGVEPEGFPAQWRAALEAKGHRLETAKRRWGNMQAVFKSKRNGIAVAASDPRGADE